MRALVDPQARLRAMGGLTKKGELVNICYNSLLYLLDSTRAVIG